MIKMEENFFGEDFRSLGAGVTEEGLLEYDSEDDLDAFNDETFGGPLEVDGDWEQNHEQLAKLEELEFGGDIDKAVADFEVAEKPTPKDDLDAFNDETFGGPLEVDGDWEQNHEQLAKLEELEFGGDIDTAVADFEVAEKPTPKDDLDAFNDETFGGPLEVDVDWEQNHEQLAKLEELEFGGDMDTAVADFKVAEKLTPKDAVSRRLDLEPIDVTSSVLSSPEAQQRDLEASISQLVLDNDEHDDSFEDPAIVKPPVNEATEPTAKDLSLQNVGYPMPGVVPIMANQQVVRSSGIPARYPSSVGLQLQHQQLHPPLQHSTATTTVMLPPGAISASQAEAAMQQQQQLYKLHQQRLQQIEIEKQQQQQIQLKESLKSTSPNDFQNNDPLQHQQNTSQHQLLLQQHQHKQMLLHQQHLHHQMQLEQMQIHQLQQQQQQQQQQQLHLHQQQTLQTTPTKTIPPPGVAAYPFPSPQHQHQGVRQHVPPQKQHPQQIPGIATGVPLPPPPIPLPSNQKLPLQTEEAVPASTTTAASTAETTSRVGATMNLNQLLMKAAQQQQHQLQQHPLPSTLESQSNLKTAPPELDDPSIVDSSVLRGFKFAADLEDEMLQPEKQQKQQQQIPQSPKPQQPQPPKPQQPQPPKPQQPQPPNPQQPPPKPNPPHQKQSQEQNISNKENANNGPRVSPVEKLMKVSSPKQQHQLQQQQQKQPPQQQQQQQRHSGGGPYPPPNSNQSFPPSLPGGFFHHHHHGSTTGMRAPPPGMPPPPGHLPPGMPPPPLGAPMNQRPNFLPPGSGFPFGPPPPPHMRRDGPGQGNHHQQQQQQHPIAPKPSIGTIHPDNAAMVPPHLLNKEILRQHHESLQRNGESNNNAASKLLKNVPTSPNRTLPYDGQQYLQQRHDGGSGGPAHRDQRRHGSAWGDGRHGGNGNNQRTNFNNFNNVNNNNNGNNNRANNNNHHEPPRNHHNNQHRNGHNGSNHNSSYNQQQQQQQQSQHDEYQLMTQKEKDWVIRIQLLQLQTDDPYTDDYYYTTFVMRKLAEELQKKNRETASLDRDGGLGSSGRLGGGGEGEGEEIAEIVEASSNGSGGGDGGRRGSGETGKTEEPKLLLPPRVTLENRSYIPVKFENSLGRITSSSVHNPRVIIDVGARRSNLTADDDEDGHDTSVRESQERFRQLLMSIEDLYMVVLAIDELGKAVLALPEEKRPTLYLERDAMIQVLYSRILYSPPGTCERPSFALLTLSSIRKGKKLVGRSIPLFSLKQQQAVLLAILDELPFLLKRDVVDKIFPKEVLPHLKETVDDSSLKALLAFAKTLLKHQAPALAAIVCSEFGLALILCFLNRAEILFVKEEETPVSAASKDVDAIQGAWRGVAASLASAMEVLGEKKIAPVKGGSAAIVPKSGAAKHLRRVLLNEKFAAEMQSEIDGIFLNNDGGKKTAVHMSSSSSLSSSS